MTSIKSTPTCIACSRPHHDADGMCSVKYGGSTYHICFGCIDGLKLVADAKRNEIERQALISAVRPNDL